MARIPQHATDFGLSLDQDERWKLVLRVAQSSEFQKATRLREFFLYVCQKTLTNRANEVHEQLIAVQVFGRPTDYNPAEDNIVRVEARELRRRLDIYFLTEGRGEKLRIRIPKGGYIPTFELTHDGATSKDNSSLASSPPADQSHLLAPAGQEVSLPRMRQEQKAFKLPLWMVVVGLLAVGLLAFLFGERQGSKQAKGRSAATIPSSLANSTSIWWMFFPASRTVELVVGDAALVIAEDLSGRVVPLSEYLNGTYLKQLENPRMREIVLHPYSSLADVVATSELQQAAITQGKNLAIRYARDLQLRDLEDKDLIFLWTSYSDPWINQIDAQRQFVLTIEDGSKRRLCFSNKSMGNEETERYCSGGKAAPQPRRTAWSHSCLTCGGPVISLSWREQIARGLKQSAILLPIFIPALTFVNTCLSPKETPFPPSSCYSRLLL